jgi:hypothetical protein
MPGYMRHTHDGQREVRLGRVQREQLQLCADAPQRRSPGNPTMRALAGHGFVESVRHVSTRTHRPTLDQQFTATAEGRRYLAIGRDRA